jgi:hypothetical protein
MSHCKTPILCIYHWLWNNKIWLYLKKANTSSEKSGFSWGDNLVVFYYLNAYAVFVINVSLFTSVVWYCQNGLRRKRWKCSLCNEWWHSFMNQRLNHLVLLYKKCNCIIMSLNAYNKNVDIIWHYCIISQTKLHGFWKRSKDDIFMTTTVDSRCLELGWLEFPVESNLYRSPELRCV